MFSNSPHNPRQTNQEVVNIINSYYEPDSLVDYNTDLSGTIMRYTEEFTAMSLEEQDFDEAALFIQGCNAIYSRKVVQLYNYTIQLRDFLRSRVGGNVPNLQSIRPCSGG